MSAWRILMTGMFTTTITTRIIPTDGSVPSGWDDFSGRHPYDYYKESDYDYPMSAILSAEPIFHDTLWPEYTTAVADLSTFSYKDYLYGYTAEQYPFEDLSNAEKTALEPQIVAGINARSGYSFTSLNDYYRASLKTSCNIRPNMI
jgi:hypothetical protein